MNLGWIFTTQASRKFRAFGMSVLALSALWLSGCALTGSGSNSQPSSKLVGSSSSSSSSPLSISTVNMPSGVVGQAYGATMIATGGVAPYSWTVMSGNLPAGLSLSSSSGLVSGIPSQQGTTSYTVQVTDSSQQTAQASLSITISPAGTSANDVELDQYGGRQDIPCTQTTPYFHTEKINNRWWLCDPAGNAFVAMSVGNIVTNGNPTLDCQGINTYPIYAAKYGDTTYNWGWQTLKRMTSWGFNSVGQDSAGEVKPWQTCSNCVWPGGKTPILLPYITEMRPGSYAAANQNGYLPEPIKDEITGTNTHFSTYRGGALFDVFDPKLNTEMQDELAKSTEPEIINIRKNYPYILAIFTDDSDWFTGSAAGPDFTTGKTTSNVGWVTLITAPVHTYVQSPAYASSKSFIFQDTKVYSKAEVSNPSTPCSISNPCSLRDYLWQKYSGNISNLNKAWGSNYTTFDSSGTAVTGETIAVANGSQQSFSYTLAKGPVSPYSVEVFVGGNAQIGDCPWFHAGCLTSTSNQGTLGSPTANYITQGTSTINYSTGAITLNFVTAPAQGTAITVNYVAQGWMAGGTGLMDEDGSHTAWVGTNPWCLEGPDPNFPTYFACKGQGGLTEPVPNANPNLGADLDNWVSQWAAEYFKTMDDDLKAVTNIPYFGLDTIGNWGAPAYSKFLQGAAPYVDGEFVNLQYWFPGPAPFRSAYQYQTQYGGDIPLMNFSVITANADSSYYCKTTGGPNDMANQAVRGQNWYNTVQYLLNTLGYNGDTQFVGFDWWSWQDFQGINQGLVSLHDNAYDGVEDVSGTVPCSSPEQNLTCGGEASNYSNAIGPIMQANLLWYTIP